MTKDEQGFRVRAAEPVDEAPWRAMWDDFIALVAESCPQSATDHIWRTISDRATAMRLLIVETDGRPAGFLLYTTHDFSRSVRKACYLLDLYVVPEARGRGLAGAMMTHLAAIGRSEGWLKISWMTQSDNANAHRLYDKFGTLSPLLRYDMVLNGLEA